MRQLIIASLAAIAIAAPASAAVVSVTSSYEIQSTQAAGDLSVTPPVFGPTLGANGQPIVLNASNYSDITAQHTVKWFTDGSVISSGGAPFTSDVNNDLVALGFAFGAPKAQYAVVLDVAFTVPTAQESPLTLSVDGGGTAVLFLNGKSNLVRSRQRNRLHSDHR